MTKLYDANSYQKDFIAEVLSIIEKEGTFHILLNQTAFYPEGGGQPCDTGFIEDCPIIQVYEENNCVYHVSTKKPIKIHKVKCQIDWARRFDHMQQHLGQHLLSACLVEHFNTNTLSFHLGEQVCTLDIDQVLSLPLLNQAENFANEIIYDNILTEVLYPTKQELKKLHLNKPLPKVTGQLRLIQIGEFDISPCCGTHPRSTIEVQLIKIIKAEKYKSGTRLHFICGQRAIKALRDNEQNYASKIQELTIHSQTLLGEVRKLKSIVTDYEVKEIIDAAPLLKDYRIVKNIYETMDSKELQALGNKLVAYPNVIALLGLKCDKTAHLVFMCSSGITKVNMNTLLKDSITLIDGRGGGSNTSAQGGGKSANNLESALDYALMKVKSSL
ncbi:MAG: DHHA1 domain-containing protein [Cellulosilyticaceae bacterium]